MSCYYVCDVCNKNITSSIARINIAIQKSGEQTKMIKHACNSCYVKHLQPLLNGNLTIMQEVAKKCLEQTVQKEPTIIEESVVQKITDEVKEHTVEPEVTPTEDNAKSFNKPQVLRKSKYFTEAKCFDIHRMILIGAKPMAIGKRFGIEYQVMRTYANNFDKNVVNDYVPTNSISELERICKTYGKKLSTVRALIATCTWSMADVANETDIPERDIIMYYEDIPWFEKEFFNKDSNTEKEANDE